MSTPAEQAEELRISTLATIKENGAEYMLRRESQRYDANNSTVSSSPRKAWNGWAADWQYTRGADGLRVSDGVRLLVAAHQMGDPLPGDVAEYAGQKLRVADNGVEFIRYAGIVVAYDVTHERA